MCQITLWQYSPQTRFPNDSESQVWNAFKKEAADGDQLWEGHRHPGAQAPDVKWGCPINLPHRVTVLSFWPHNTTHQLWSHSVSKLSLYPEHIPYSPIFNCSHAFFSFPENSSGFSHQILLKIHLGLKMQINCYLFHQGVQNYSSENQFLSVLSQSSSSTTVFLICCPVIWLSVDLYFLC